jgi:acetylglutamate kinase
MDQITVIKVGGKLLNNKGRLDEALSSFATIKGGKILVHGGGSEASELAVKMGVEVKMVEGRRITDDDMINIVTMVYGGKVNKQVVALLQAKGINAMGLSGADGNLILSDRRPVKSIDYGHVGDVKNVNGAALHSLLKIGFVPVFCALTHDGKGNMLNTNADTIASSIAVELSKSFSVKLCYTFELAGVLSDFNDKSSVISRISLVDFEKMKRNKVVNEGMIPKIHNALEASKKGVDEVFICQFDMMHEPQKGSEICYK